MNSIKYKLLEIKGNCVMDTPYGYFSKPYMLVTPKTQYIATIILGILRRMKQL